MRAMGLNPFEFNWLQAPDSEALQKTEMDLKYLEAIHPDTAALTEVGALAAAAQVECRAINLLILIAHLIFSRIRTSYFPRISWTLP